MYGLTPDGFKKKSLRVIKEEIEANLKNTLGDNISLIPQSIFGQIIGVQSERESLIWDEMENVYNSQYPSTAQGYSLSELVLLNSIKRKEATQSTATVTITGVDGTEIPKSSTIKTNDTGEVFTIDNDIIIDGSTTVTATSVNYGEIVAVAGSLNVIDSAIFGWDSVTNSSDAKVGTDEETDSELRQRREESVGTDAQNLADSLYAQLKNSEGVSDVKVLENKTDTTDSNGIPPHQFLAVIRGGENENIASLIWKNTPQGIDSYGLTTETITDVQGYPQEVHFSRPIDKEIYFDIDITTNSNFPLDGEDEIKLNVATFGSDNFNINDDVIQSRFFTAVNETLGIVDIEIKLGFNPSPTQTANLPIAATEVSAYDTTRININVS